MQSPAPALLLTCIDARLHRADKPHLAEYVRGKHVGIQTWNLLAFPGGAYHLASGDAGGVRDALLSAVKKAHEALGVGQVLLVNHSDCDAYGGAQAFSDVTAEFRKHAEDLRAARALLRQAVPNLDIRLFFATVEARADGPFVTFDEVR